MDDGGGDGDGVILCHWSLMWIMVVVMALYCAILESDVDDGGGDGDRAILCYWSMMLVMVVVVGGAILCYRV